MRIVLVFVVLGGGNKKDGDLLLKRKQARTAPARGVCMSEWFVGCGKCLREGDKSRQRKPHGITNQHELIFVFGWGFVIGVFVCGDALGRVGGWVLFLFLIGFCLWWGFVCVCAWGCGVSLVGGYLLRVVFVRLFSCCFWGEGVVVGRGGDTLEGGLLPFFSFRFTLGEQLSRSNLWSSAAHPQDRRAFLVWGRALFVQSLKIKLFLIHVACLLNCLRHMTTTP